MRSTFSITFYLKKSVVYKDMKSPIMARIRVSGSTADFSTKLQVNPNDWNPAKGRGKGKKGAIFDLNIALNAIEKCVNDIKTNFIVEKGYVSAIEIREKYVSLTKTPEEKEKERKKLEQQVAEQLEKERQEREEQERKERGISLIDYFNNYIESRRDEVTAGQLTEKTFSRYQSARDRLITYMEEKYKTSDIPLKHIDIFFIKNFEMYLRSNFACGNNTIMKIVQKLCSVVTLAHDTGVIPVNPFRLYKFRFEETERDILTLEELNYLYNYQFISKKLERVRDNYIFSCYTGLAYTDTDKLDIQNIKDFFDGNDWIIKRREKTNVESKILLLDIPRQILKKYEGKLSKGQLLPVISNQKTNDYLKEIAAITGIGKRLTFHTARHTFATSVCLSNGVPLESLQKMLGHKSIRTTQIYAKIVDIKLSEDMHNLKERLKEKQSKIEDRSEKGELRIIPKKAV